MTGMAISPGWIEDAMKQLEDVNSEAEEEGYPAVGDKARQTAAHLLKMLDCHLIEPDIYPSMDGEIAIYFKVPDRPLSFLISIDNGQRIDCYVAGEEDSRYMGFEELSEEALEYMHDVLNRMDSPISLQGGLAGIIG